jgi:very-short-patch-repair endonuclease
MLDPPPRVEVAVPRGSSRLRPDAGAVVHWVENRADPAQPSLVGLQEALVRVILDHDLEVSVPCIDWALATGRLERVPYERLILALPQEARCITDWVDGRAQSVLESVARVRLLRRGWRTRSQVPVGDIEAIDLVIEDHVALELDGREFHQDRFERDRLKDLRIAVEGRHSIRVSYRMLRNNWPDVERAVGVALRRRGVRVSGIAPREPRGRRHATGAGRLDG